MPLQHANDSTARSGADAIRLAFDAYQREFRQITRRARSRFEGQDWRGMQQDARDRLDLGPGGVDPKIEYVDSDFDAPPLPPDERVYRRYVLRGSVSALVMDLLGDYAHPVPYRDLDFDARTVADAIEAERRAAWGGRPGEAIEILRPGFYRNKGAYLIG